MKPEEVNTRHPKPWTGLDMSGVGACICAKALLLVLRS